MAGLASMGIKLGYKTTGDKYTDLAGLLEIPEVGGEAEKIDVTTLSDTTKKYIPGVKDLGDMAFKFLYDNSKATSNYRVLKGAETAKTIVDFKLEYPDKTSHAFSALVSVKMDSVSVNSPLTFTASFSLQSEVAVTDPAQG
jgi:hypothetical protein